MALWLGGPQEINGWAGRQEIQNSGNQIFEIKGKAGPQEIIWLGGNQWLGHRESMARPQNAINCWAPGPQEING